MNNQLKHNLKMTFEFDYDQETDQITIIYDGSFVLKADFDGERAIFKNFDKVGDEDLEQILKSLCKATFNVLA